MDPKNPVQEEVEQLLITPEWSAQEFAGIHLGDAR